MLHPVQATATAIDFSERLTWKRVGFGRRLVAAIIDGTVISIVSAILRALLGQAVGSLLGVAFGAAYFTYFHGRTGQSPGNAALGIRVVDLRDGTGGPIGYARAFVRWLVSIPSFVVVLVGYLWMLWDPEKQTWHDKAAGSVVIPASLDRYD
jgi:uncharacterized RDD family membrane protein YckC